MSTLLNYGCGNDYRDNYFNVDHSQAVKTDFCGEIWDVAAVPSNKERFNYVILRHVFEHIYHQMDFMEALYVVCAPSAIVEIHCPYYTSRDAWSDPDHKRAISESTFLHFDRAAYLWGPNNPITPASEESFLPICDFVPVENCYVMDKSWEDKSAEEQLFARQHYMNTVVEFRVKLRCMKPARTE